jgi:hypothetical protein
MVVSSTVAPILAADPIKFLTIGFREKQILLRPMAGEADLGFQGIALEQLLLNERETIVVEQPTKTDALLETMAEDANVLANTRVGGIVILIFYIDSP